MATTIVNGQTPLLVSDFITRLTQSDSSYLKSGIDFFASFKIAMPAYSKTFAGEYFEVAHGSGDPTALPSPLVSGSTGNIYEAPMPSDAMDSSIQDVVFANASGIFDELNVLQQENEQTWDTTKTTTAYWRHAGRKIRFYLPLAYTSSTPTYSTPYKRYSAIPTSSSDQIDCPAEDVMTVFNNWKQNIVKV